MLFGKEQSVFRKSVIHTIERTQPAITIREESQLTHKRGRRLFHVNATHRKETYCMSTSATPTLLTLQEACELLRFSPSRIYYLTSTERIPHLKFGGTLRFDRDELLRWVEQHRRGPAA